MSEFIPLLEVNSLPAGQGRTVIAQGREFAVFNLDGEFYVLDDRCPHRGGPLGAGTLVEGRVYCPFHGWGFDLKTGACQDQPDRPVAVYPTRIYQGQLQIRLERG